MDVTADGDRRIDLNDIAFLDQELSSFETELPDFRFGYGAASAKLSNGSTRR